VLKEANDLKPEYATLLSAVVVDGRPIVEVAAELGISANNATVRMHRARTALKQRLVDLCGTESLRACLNCSCDERRCGGDA
jgi:RNA polymerase sigma-70 factor (ECF subfamily)